MEKVMRMLSRTMACAVVAIGAISCARSDAPTSAWKEYNWALVHGACDCGPIAYAPGNAVPNWLHGETFKTYVQEKAGACTSEQFVVAAFGDGNSDLEADMKVARARAEPFVHQVSLLKRHGRLDTLILAGPHIAHPATLVILCPTARLPAQDTF